MDINAKSSAKYQRNKFKNTLKDHTAFIQNSTVHTSKSNQIRKRNKKHPKQKEIKGSLFTDDMILDAENSKDYTYKNNFRTNKCIHQEKLYNTKSRHKNQVHF